MKKLLYIVLSGVKFVLRGVFSKTLNRIIFFEGGLGSQIISYMLVEALKNKNIEPLIDFDYFTKKNTKENPSRWDWELDVFGIDEKGFQDCHGTKLVERNLLRIARVLRDFSGRARYESNLIQECPLDSISQLLPIPEETYSTLENLSLLPFNYSVVHIRKGDYLTLSSRVVSVEESLAVLEKFAHFNFGKVVFATDGHFDVDEIKLIKSSIFSDICIFLQSDTYSNHSIHGMMRLSKVLITSNSTFSWTAGLLNTNPESITLSPTRFFYNSNLDEVFQRTSSWMLMK